MMEIDEAALICDLAEILKASVPFKLRMDIGVIPEKVHFAACFLQKINRIHGTRTAATVQQQ